MPRPEATAKARPRIGLVLQGGGARGAYQIGVLKAITELVPDRRAPISVFSGTSVGAINAAPLAASAYNLRRGVARLERLWRGLHCGSIYDTRSRAIIAKSVQWVLTLALGGFGVGNPRSLLDNAPLHRLLQREFRRDGLERAVRSGALHALCITASSYGGGRAITFFEGADEIEEWHRARRQGRRARIDLSHLMASSALPFLFPAVPIGSRYFGDGALRLTAPLSPAIRAGADRLLVIGARDNIESDEDAPDDDPSIGEIVGHSLDILFNDNLDADLERLSRVNRTLQLVPDKEATEMNLRVIDTVMIQPSRDLRQLAVDHLDEMPGSIRFLLRSVGSWGDRNGRLTSYLLFEPGYIGKLVDLAYEDTMNQADDVRRLFFGSAYHDTGARAD